MVDQINDQLFTTYVKDFKDIIFDDQFKLKQNQFFIEHNEFFDDSETNKFEYTSIFEEYQNLLEKLIFNKIMSLHPNFDINLFLDKLKSLDEKGQLYEIELTDVLLSFTDFENFKSLILESKKNNLFLGGSKEDKDNLFSYANMMKTIQDKEGWAKSMDSKEMKASQFQHKTVEYLYMIQSDVSDIPMKKFSDTMYDVDDRINRFLNPTVKEQKPPKKFEVIYKFDNLKDDSSKDLLKLDGDSYLILYFEIEMPVVSNRDFLLFYRFGKQKSQNELFYFMRGLDIEKSQEDRDMLQKLGRNPEDFKINPNQKIVRAIYNRFYHVKEENGKRELSAIVKFDMAFYIPKFVWNWMLGKGFNVMFKKGMDVLRAKK